MNQKISYVKDTAISTSRCINLAQVKLHKEPLFLENYIIYEEMYIM